MKWLSCCLIIFSLLGSKVYANDYETKQQEYIIIKIEKLLKEQPDNWGITNDTLFYCPHKEYVDDTFSESYPEHVAYTDIVIKYRIMRGGEQSYIVFQKPDLGILSDRDFGNDEKKLYQRIDRIVKILLYKKLKKEVGVIADIQDNQSRQKIEEKPEEIVPTTNHGLQPL